MSNDHQRKVIRHKVAALLKGSTDAGDRVYASRVLPYRKLQLPAISVYTLDDDVTADSITTAPRELTRELSLVIECWVAAAENTDDSLDDIARQVESVMHADPYLAGDAADSILNTTTMEVLEESERRLGFVSLAYQVIYRTLAPEAPDDLEDLETVHTEYNLGGDVHEDDVAIDEIDVRSDE